MGIVLCGKNVLVVVEIAAQRRVVVVVALARVPRPLRLERHVPVRVGRVLLLMIRKGVQENGLSRVRGGFAQAARLLWWAPPRAVRTCQCLPDASVPRVGPHAPAIDPDALAETRGRAHDHLLLQELLVVHRATRDPQRFGVRPAGLARGTRKKKGEECPRSVYA